MKSAEIRRCLDAAGIRPDDLSELQGLLTAREVRDLGFASVPGRVGGVAGALAPPPAGKAP